MAAGLLLVLRCTLQACKRTTLWNPVLVQSARNLSHRAARLQAYPFLAQVCRHWKAVLESPEALPALWQDLVVDFSHELITGA